MRPRRCSRRRRAKEPDSRRGSGLARSCLARPGFCWCRRRRQGSATRARGRPSQQRPERNWRTGVVEKDRGPAGHFPEKRAASGRPAGSRRRRSGAALGPPRPRPLRPLPEAAAAPSLSLSLARSPALSLTHRAFGAPGELRRTKRGSGGGERKPPPPSHTQLQRRKSRRRQVGKGGAVAPKDQWPPAGVGGWVGGGGEPEKNATPRRRQ